MLALGVLALAPAAWATGWNATPEVVRGTSGRTITGVVFEDVNGNGRHEPGEDGVPGVLVSNGLDVVRTDSSGAYVVDVRPDMDVFVIQPSGWKLPVDARGIPQFSYTHKPGGSPGNRRYGGLPDTGPAPEAVNFPLQRAPDAGKAFTCAMVGDSQTYNNVEAGQFRDSAIADLVAAGLDDSDCMLYLGDVAGDDLGMLERVFELGSVVGVPQWAVAGNHDVDFDVESDADSLDTWRRVWGPAYYAFEQGDVLFVGMDNIFTKPCGPHAKEVARASVREKCGQPFEYTHYITQVQLDWLGNLLRHVPEDRLVVLAMHAPLLTFDAASELQHTLNAAAVHELLEGRQALVLGGHAHTLWNFDPGEHYEGFGLVGVGPLPFRHIVAGAASGRWWSGDFNVDGDPQSLTSSGEPKGLLMVEFDGTDYRERFFGTRLGDRGQWVDFSTPAFRNWHQTLNAWLRQPAGERDPVPPVTTNDLPDTHMFTPEDLKKGVYATVNFWQGSAGSQVVATIDGGPELLLERTQQGVGEPINVGVDYVDPFASQRIATVGRWAYASRSGDDLTQGHVRGKGNVDGRVRPPQPYGELPEKNHHLWRTRLAEDLAEGVHVLTVTSTDRNGQSWTDSTVFEVRAVLPSPHYPRELWE